MFVNWKKVNDTALAIIIYYTAKKNNSIFNPGCLQNK